METLHYQDILSLIKQITRSLLGELRNQSVDWNDTEHWDENTPLGEAGCGLDSLECAALSVHIYQFFQCFDLTETPRISPSIHLGELASQLSNLAPQLKDIGFLTSGFTGVKKCIVHSRPRLDMEIQQLLLLFTPTRRIIYMVPSFHLYGFLFSVLLPKAMNINAIDAKRFMPYELISSLTPGDLVVAYPDYWSLIKQLNHPIPAGVTFVSSTAPCPTDLKLAMVTLGAEQFVEIYGSTETSGIGYRQWPDTHYSLFDFWQINATDQSISLKLNSHLETAIELPDKVTWTSHRQFEINGRLDNVVQVGGINVDISTVEKTLLDHPHVKLCRVRKMKPAEGNRLKAFIVWSTSLKKTEIKTKPIKQLEQWVGEHLSPVERPKHFEFGDSLPKNTIGKHCEWGVQQEDEIPQKS